MHHLVSVLKSVRPMVLIFCITSLGLFTVCEVSLCLSACLLDYDWNMCFCVCFKELTEEGIPFLILFHQKDDTESLEKFQQEVARQLISEKGMDGPVRIIFHKFIGYFL